ncbi:hypothetical protein ACHAPT_002745 [Fusarium lateritium]
MVNFHLSSEDIELEDGHILVAKCGNGDGDMVESRLDLDYYIGNDGGSFSWGGENFSHSASDIELSIEGDDNVPVLRAKLGNGDGEEFDANVNLAERIGNDGGNLVFVQF